jgi:hypothetical protein
MKDENVIRIIEELEKEFGPLTEAELDYIMPQIIDDNDMINIDDLTNK